jgi:hypothetical protein
VQTRFIEAVQSHNRPMNHGKFMLGRFTLEEWAEASVVSPGMPLVSCIGGWTPDHLLVLDLATGEGAIFKPGGHALADLSKHKIWTCPLFPHFLAWLYEQNLIDLNALPAVVEVPDAEFSLYGKRWPGPQ